MPDISGFLDKCRWLGQAGFLFQDRLVVYVDPVALPAGLPIADVILLTHNHPEHCSIPDVQKISSPQTVVVGPADAVCRFRLNQLPLSGGQTKSVLGIPVTATVSYTNDERHPRGGPWLGFLFEILGLRILHPGDSLVVPELAGLSADVALLPIGEGLMEPAAAVGLAKDLKARLALPMHFGQRDRDRAELFVRLAREAGLESRVAEGQPA